MPLIFVHVTELMIGAREMENIIGNGFADGYLGMNMQLNFISAFIALKQVLPCKPGKPVCWGVMHALLKHNPQHTRGLYALVHEHRHD